MDTRQSPTSTQKTTEVDAENVGKQKRLKWAQEQWITYCAASGISLDEDGNFTTVTVKQFAVALGVHRDTLYEWKKSIPHFWQLVDERAREMFNQQTKYAIMKGLKLKAMTGDVKAAEMVLSHYSDYTPPAQKHEVKLNGWADLVKEARTNKIKKDGRDAAEAQVIDVEDDIPVVPYGEQVIPELSTAPAARPVIEATVTTTSPQPAPQITDPSKTYPTVNPPLPTPTHQPVIVRPVI